MTKKSRRENVDKPTVYAIVGELGRGWSISKCATEHDLCLATISRIRTDYKEDIESSRKNLLDDSRASIKAMSNKACEVILNSMESPVEKTRLDAAKFVMQFIGNPDDPGTVLETLRKMIEMSGNSWR